MLVGGSIRGARVFPTGSGDKLELGGGTGVVGTFLPVGRRKFKVGPLVADVGGVGGPLEGGVPPAGVGALPEGVLPPAGVGGLPEGVAPPAGVGGLPEGVVPPAGIGGLPVG
jgi:hypothetical protein